ncbi:hypothetical protein WA026_007544 [Henosepilachna vigintioctopunctata]|uniref:FLYWCH-type domain-containing protein n=1 Tax=Henosepilachna vigintioctopunctata TaxID=420089 RepID=A0AAW1UU79_9CUCU
MLCHIYFDVGIKNPKIILDGHDFTCHRKERNKTMWMCCSYYKTKCKTKLSTSGRVVVIYGEEHNHPPKEKVGIKNILPQQVTIIRKFQH